MILQQIIFWIQKNFEIDLQKTNETSANKVEAVLKRCEEKDHMIESLYGSVRLYLWHFLNYYMSILCDYQLYFTCKIDKFIIDKHACHLFEVSCILIGCHVQEAI